jgi:hypothetical protein
MIFTILITIVLYSANGTSVSTQQVPFKGSVAQCQAFTQQLIKNRIFDTPNSGAATVIQQTAQCIQIN